MALHRPGSGGIFQAMVTEDRDQFLSHLPAAPVATKGDGARHGLRVDQALGRQVLLHRHVQALEDRALEPEEALPDLLARQLVDRPDEVRVERVEQEDGAVALRLHVAPDEIGKVIGRSGRIARALRTVVRAASGHRRERMFLEIVDE